VIAFTGTDSYQIAVAYGGDQLEQRPASFDRAIEFVRETRQEIGFDDSPHWDKALEANVASQTHAVYLPIASEGNMLGVFFVQLKSGRRLLAEDRQVISSLANHIAVVLQRDKLVEAQAKAQGLAEANRLKTALLQMVSHDFRSPLTSIKASVSSLLVEEGTPPDSATQRGLLQAIEEETDRLNRMVGNVLDFSRLEANAWQSKREAFSLGELIGTALDSFDGGDNARINVDLAVGNIDVFVDCVQMAQVLRNLLENALKYSPRDTTVELTATIDGGCLLVNVSDRGPGLSAGEELLVFEPFYRGKQHQEGSLPGMGMGLAVCKGLVEAHGGSLTAYNREGSGAVFCVRLPPDAVIANESTCN
jgi:two-component system sensor histidine kinase KdpD